MSEGWNTRPASITSLNDLIEMTDGDLFLRKSFSHRSEVHRISARRCNSKPPPDPSRLLTAIGEQEPHARRRPTRSVILISLALFCRAALLMEQETAVVCGVRKQLGDRQSVLWERWGTNCQEILEAGEASRLHAVVLQLWLHDTFRCVFRGMLK